MSVNQSRAERTQGQLRKPSRSGNSGQQRGFLGGSGGAGKGGGISAPPHPPFSTSISHAVPPTSSISPSLSTNRSFRKSGNGHGSQSRVNPESAISEPGGTVPTATALRVVPNGPQASVHSSGISEAPASVPGKSDDMSNSRNAPRSIPKAPSSQASTGPQPAEQAKGDASRTFTLQFGTINPGIVNGLQIPARTSSAPPNLDEQKRDQARAESFRAPSVLPIPSVPKQQHQQPSRKDIGVAHQSNNVDPRLVTQIKRDVSVQVPSAAVVNPPKSSVHPLSGMPMPMTMPFQPQQPQVPQFGGPSPQMQSPNLVANSLQMPMNIPMGNAPPVAQQIFVPGVQPHFVQQQTMMHQGQGLGYAPPIGHQFPQQLGNLGMNIAPQFSQQQPNKPVGTRKTTVKITHPETHEELRLDKRTDTFKDGVSSGQRPLPNVISQSQPIATYTTAQPMNYYPSVQQNSYGPSPLMFPTSVPLASGQVPTSSQAPRYSYPVGQSGQHLSFMNSSMVNTIPGSKPVPPRGISEGVNLESLPVSTSSLASGQIAAKPSLGSQGEKGGVSSSTPPVVAGVAVYKGELPKPSKAVADASISYQRHIETSKDGPDHQLKPASEPPVSVLSVTDTNSFVSSSQRLHHEAISAPETQAGDSGSSLSGNDEKKREPVTGFDSSKDNQRKQSKKDVRSFQQHPKLDASFSEEAKSPFPSTTKGGSAGELITQDGSTKTENPETLLTSDLTTSSAWSSLKSENKNVLEIVAIEPVEDKVIPTASGLSESEKETHQEGNTTSSGISTKVVPSVASTLSTMVDGTNSENLPTESSAVITVFDVKVETTENSLKSEAPNASYKDPDDVNECSSSTITDTVMLLKENDRVENDEKLKTSDYAEVDNKLLGHSIEDIHPGEENMMKEKNRKNDTPIDLTDSVTAVDRDILSADADKHGFDPLTIKGEIKYAVDAGLTDSGVTHMSGPVSNPSTSVISQKLEPRVIDSRSDELVSATSLGQKEKSFPEASKPKATGGKKKKRKDILSKADAAGTSDLYNAYKGPEEKPEVVHNSESVDSLTADTKFAIVDHPDKDVIATKEDSMNKAELDDWENAADISTPKLRTSEHEQLADGAREQDGGGDGTMGKKYTRDFLMTLSSLYTDLPVGFEIGSDIADVFMSNPLAKSPVPSPGRIIDRPSGGRRMVSNLEDDKWTRGSVPFNSGRDGRLDGGYGSAVNHRPGQGATHGVLRNPRAQSGILSGPMQSLPYQGGATRGGPDVDRWQRARGLIPSPQTPMQVMHKAEKKYEVGKITDEEEAKQRQLKGILNKLTPQNFEKLFGQVNDVNIDNAVTLTGVISQIFDKALMEPTFCEMYANFCFHLAGVLPDFNEDNEKITFKRLLLNKCQEEFERGEREQAEANKVEEEGEVKQSEEEREEKRLRARRRMLGNIRLIGELYKKKMLTERIMHECIQKLLGQYQNPDEEDVEALCKLMSTIGEMIDHPKAKEHMDAYFDMMTKMSTNQKLSSRVRFMLRDSIDLRKNKWQQRRKIEGPKKIEEVHRDAAQERQAQSSRLGRGPVITNVPRRGQAVDYGSRGSASLSSPNPQQVGGSRGLPSQARGYGTQDARMDDRHHFDGRALSLPLPQRSTDDDYITLGPQGGLARGMSMRGHASISNIPPNGTSFKADRVSGASHDQLSPRDRSNHHGSREKIDRPFDRSITSILPAGRTQGTSGISVTAVESKTLSEDVLQQKSIQAIREFYSAKDENEVVLCIKELNAPNFYPSAISLWITDSFERKDMERDLLSKLIINVCKPKDSLLNQAQLLRGFDSVLSSLEDAVNDAPKAPEFLGRLFAKVVMENVVSLRDVGKLLHEGGEEPGNLRELGLAAEVLGNILETIRSERGATVLNEIQANSNLRLDEFRPSRPMRSKLDAFL